MRLSARGQREVDGRAETIDDADLVQRVEKVSTRIHARAFALACAVTALPAVVMLIAG